MSTEHAKPLYNAKNPFQATHTVNIKLTGPASEKDTRHHEISLAGSGLTYEVGDALALKATNDPELVELTIQALGAKGDEPVKVKEVEKPLREALFRDYQIHFIEKKFLAKAAEKGAAKLAELLKPENAAALTEYTSARNASRDYVDVLREFPEVKFTPQEFCDQLRALAIRLYSISSSLKAHPESVHLTVATVRWNAHGRQRNGVCSTFLADRWSGDTTAGVFGQMQKHFRLPEDPNTPVIMVGPGTGVAPFRAFLEDREATGAKGRNWLFFGDQRREQDFFYRDQFEGWVKNGLLSRLDLAFSRDQAEKVYVQHRMAEAGAELWKWLNEGAYFYVCGDKNRMAADVHAALIAIAQKHGGKTEEEAKAFIEEGLMKTEKRYRRDVY
ncbi:MAG: sulfite reductase flavoprotein alpha-component CysI [Verrucomicrobiota bacterium]|jgi:sulfite reductase (NADPH) flavoprotein alpha-component